MIKNIEYPKTAWEYADWLYFSGRLTNEEFINLKRFLVQLEEEAKTSAYINEGC